MKTYLSRGTEGRGTRQRQEIEEDGEGEGRGDGVFGTEGQRTASGKWRFIKVQGKPCVRMRCLISTGHVNYFDSWTSQQQEEVAIK